jgi:hypothetical protein
MSAWRIASSRHGESRSGIPAAVLAGGIGLILLAASGRVFAGSEDMRVSSQIQYAKVIQGFSDPVTDYIYNFAPVGSDTLNYSAYLTTPAGNSGTATGMRAADGGAGYDVQNFYYDTTNAALGNNNLSVTTTDTAAQTQITQSGSVQVLQRGVLGLYWAAGGVVPLSAQPQAPAAENPVADPYAFGGTGGGEMASAKAPQAIDDPPPDLPTDDLDLDGVSATGDPQITITLEPFIDLPPDDPSASPPWYIDLDASVPGTYFTDFELNYSDEQDVGGADAPGSEHGYFGVYADVVAVSPTENDWSIWLVVPEPASFSMLLVAPFVMLSRRSRRRNVLTREGPSL